MKIKKLLAAVFFCAAIICAMSITGFADETIGISTVDELQAISGEGNYILLNDIDASGLTTIENFNGTLDGDGYKITNLTCSLFNNIDNAEVTDLTIENASITGQYNLEEGNSDIKVGILAKEAGYSTIANVSVRGVIDIDVNAPSLVGGLFGFSSRNIVANCFYTGDIDVTSTNDTADVNVGGIAGGTWIQDDYGEYSKCVTNGTILCNDANKAFLGGISGYFTVVGWDKGSIGGCSSNMNISGTANEIKAGGMSGLANYQSAIRESFSSVTINITGEVDAVAGGIIGYGELNASINNCYVTDCDITVTVNDTTKTAYAGGLAGLTWGSGNGMIYIGNCILIDNNISAGAKDCAGIVAGGQAHNSSYSNCYFNGGSNDAFGSQEGDNFSANDVTAKDDAEIRDVNTYSNWEGFGEIWDISDEGIQLKEVKENVPYKTIFVDSNLTGDDGEWYEINGGEYTAVIGKSVFVNIDSAVEAANEGDTIIILPGEYTFIPTIDNKEVLYINKPITLKGENDVEITGSIRIQSGDVIIDGLKFTEPVVLPAADNDPICIDINTVVAPATSYDNITITNCDFTPTTKYIPGVVGQRTKGIVTSSTGKYNNLVISNNTFGNLETAIHLNPASNGITNVVISGNTSDDTNGTFAKLESVQTATITNNEISAPIYVRPDWNATNPTPSTDININENAFLGGNAVINVDKAGQKDGFDISANYWENIEAPSPENCVKVTYQGGSIGETVTPTMTSYYTNYIDGELSNLVKYVSESSAVDKKVTFKQIVDEATGKATNQFYVYLEGSVTDEITEITEPAQIKDLVAVDVKINVTGAQIGDSSDKYSFAFESFEVADDRWQFHLEDGNRFLIYQKGDIDGNADLSGEKILLGTLTLGGYGEGTLKAEPGAEENTVEQRSDDGMNLVKSSMLSGEEFLFEIKAETATLNVKVQFNNEISDNPTDYQQMWAEITGGTLTETKVIEFGNDSSVVLNEDSYSFTCNDLIKGRKYTVAIKGEGYRTAHYTVTMDADEKNLSFWNNVKDAATVIETGADESTAVVKNYLAGDILKDNVIDIYDLSAVVSYFGEEGLNVGGETYNKGYAKYDLNRDGKIDSKDVAMVLVSWGK